MKHWTVQRGHKLHRLSNAQSLPAAYIRRKGAAVLVTDPMERVLLTITTPVPDCFFILGAAGDCGTAQQDGYATLSLHWGNAALTLTAAETGQTAILRETTPVGRITRQSDTVDFLVTEDATPAEFAALFWVLAETIK